MYEQILQLYPDERLLKKKPNNVVRWELMDARHWRR
jgi:hypothetical protein